jgi:leucyl/phenylalanyl-tRNA--protein transferase
MFSTRRDASKVALVHLAGRLIAGDYRLLDTQFITEHLEQFGTTEISARRLSSPAGPGLDGPGRLLPAGGGATGAEVLQAISQAS